MAGNKVVIGELAETLAAELAKYSAAVADGVKEEVDATMKGLVADTKRDAPGPDGDYKRAITSKKAFENHLEKRMVWYVRKPHYVLSHLLEKGHLTRNGGRTRAFPHIEKNAEAATARFEERVKKRIQDGY